MAVNQKLNLTLQPYDRGSTPTIEQDYINYLQDELSKIERALRSLNVAGIEVLDAPPLSPVKGMLKYNLWDEFSDGSEGLVYYNGSAWVSI